MTGERSFDRRRYGVPNTLLARQYLAAGPLAR